MSHYFNTLFQGEKKHGRFMFLDHLEDERIKLTFVRFINQITSKKNKMIGFEIRGTKEDIFKTML